MGNAKQKVVVGVDNVYYAIVTQDDDDGYVVGSPAKLAPAMEIKGKPQINQEGLYADNGLDDDLQSEGPTELEVTSPNFAEEIISNLTGGVYDSATGRIFENADASRAKTFALGYRFKKSNGHYRYRWYLKCRAQLPAEEAQSESEKVTYKPSTLIIKAYRTVYKFDQLGDGSYMQGSKRVKGDEDDENFNASTWFNAVQVPVAGSPASFTLSPSPADAATGVLVSANVVLTFSNALAGGEENGIILVRADTGAAIACSRTIDAARKVVTLDPNSNLTSAKTYLVIVPGVTDIHGQTLADTVIDFTTA